MRKILPNQVCLIITTWRGQVGATHFYGRLRDYNTPEVSCTEWGDNEVLVTHLLTAKQAAVMNKKDGSTGKSYTYEAGEPSERFDNEQSVKEAAIHMACEKWGEDVEIYVGNPARALENMEQLRWVRKQKA